MAVGEGLVTYEWYTRVIVIGSLSFMLSVEVRCHWRGRRALSVVSSYHTKSPTVLEGPEASSIGLLVTLDRIMTLDITPKKSNDAKGVLRWAALFLGELRDGLTMVRARNDALNGRKARRLNLFCLSQTSHYLKLYRSTCKVHS